jgi:hypothetical protein
MLNSKAKKVLVLDFGSGFVKGFCLLRNQNRVIIQKAAEQPIKFFTVFDTAKEKKETALYPKNFYLEIIEKAAGKVLAELGPAAITGASVMIGLPANCLKVRVAKISYQRDKAKKKITSREAKAIYRQVFQEAKSQVLLELKQTGQALPQEIKVLRARILEIKISGYQVSDITGFLGQDFDFRVLTIFLNTAIWPDFQKIIHNLGIKNYQIYHTVEGLMKIQAYLQKEQAVFVAVGARFTQFFGFKKGFLEAANEFEAGGMELTAALQERLKISEAQAEELKLGFATNSLSPKVTERVKQIFQPTVERWIKYFQEKIEAAHLVNVPILFIGGGCLLTELKSRQGGALDNNGIGKAIFRAVSLDVAQLPLDNPRQIKLSSHYIEPILLGLVDY